MAATRTVQVRQLRNDSGLLAEHLLREQAVSEEALVKMRPGGANNPHTDAQAWLKYYRDLHRAHAVHEAAKAKQGGGLTDAAEMALVDVLRGAPQEVVCVARESDEEGAGPLSVKVYPKSFHALMEIATIDRMITWATAHLDRLQESEHADDLALTARILPEITRLYRVIVQIVTHPGCGLPYAEGSVPAEAEPWVMRLDVADLFRINRAHHQVNMIRLEYMRQLIARTTGTANDTRPSWTVFFGAAAEALHLRPETLMRDWSLAEVLLMYEASAHVKKEAMEKAKAEAETTRQK